MRKGSRVRYIGSNELMMGKIFTVEKKEGNYIRLYAPIKYSDGSIHYERMSMRVSDFEREV